MCSVHLPCGLTEAHIFTAEASLAGVMGCARHPDGSSRWCALMPLLRPSLFQNFAVIVAGRDWGQEEKGMTKDEMAGWHHQLDGHEFE